MKQVIILFGQPGAGKGTQAELLSDKLNLFYFETSKILEETFKTALEKDEIIEVDGEKFSALKEKEIWTKGLLCDPPFVTYLVKKKINELADAGKNLILAGSPRTVYEGEKLIPFLKDLYGAENIKVIFIDISADATIFRNSHRRICSLMRHPILYNKETEKLSLCPLDGSILEKRKGLDDLETIKVRLKQYEERTLPLLKQFSEQGLEIKKINGEQSVSDVFDNILKQLN